MTTSRFVSSAALVATLVTTSPGHSAAATPTGSAIAVPILMYHVIGHPRADAPLPELYVSEADFTGQMRWLARHGYQAVTERAVWDHWHRGRALPAKPIVISFDDGYRSVYTAAFPQMQAHHWPGVMNLAVKNLRVSGGLSQFKVRNLLAADWELASHTLTHPDLTGLGDRVLRHEISYSKTVLQERFNLPVDFFCYPAGRYNARVVDAVRRAGYLGATTTVEGLARPDNPYELERIRVSRSDGVTGLAEGLTARAER